MIDSKGVISMSDIISGLKEMDTTTLAILGFAALLLIFLLVLIIITIRVLRSGGEVPDDKKSSYDDDDEEEEDEDDEDEDEDEDDEMSRRVREAVESVNETKAKVEAERIAREMENAEQAEKDEAREAAAAKVEEIANAIHAENSGETEDAEEEELEEEAEEAPVGPSPIIGGTPAETEDADAEEEATDEDGFEETEGEESDEEYSQDDGYEPTPDDADTNELDTTRIRDELKKERNAAKESEDDLNEMARERAEAPEYNASFDSAFVDRPVYEEKVEPVIPNPTPESILGADAPVGPNANMLGGDVPDHVEGAMQMPPLMTPEQPAVAGPVITPEVSPMAGPVITPEMPAEAPAAPAKKKKKKKKKKEVEAPVFEPVEDGKTPRYFWYNQQDVEGLARKEDLYFKSHYFNHPEEVILDLITEMYDCGFVRTEELQRIAYGITFKSLGMKEILHSDESLGFNKDNATKEPTEADKQEAYEKWCKYVNNFMEIIVINAPQEVTNYILQKMYDYGNRDIEELMYSPY